MNHCYDASSDESNGFYVEIAWAMTLESENVRHDIEQPDMMTAQRNIPDAIESGEAERFNKAIGRRYGAAKKEMMKV